MTSLNSYRQVEVKAILDHAGRFWLGTANGLFSLDLSAQQVADPVAGWTGMEIQALGRDGEELLVAAYGDTGPCIARCGSDGGLKQRLAFPEGEKVKVLTSHKGTVWIGTKRGLYRQDATGWQHVYDGGGKAEIIGIWSAGERICASVKKSLPDDRPALIESLDDGANWTVEIQPDYQDCVVAANEETIITRWRGARRRGAKAGFKKHPITAGQILSDGRTAVVDGDKMEVAGKAGKLATYHPAFGDAQLVHLLEDGVIVAGSQGAWRFEPSTGRLASLLPATASSGKDGKIKRLFALDDVLLATTTFGTFRSFDMGESWEPSDAEWWVLDAEHAARDATGRWWIVCQRGLFRTDDRGARIDYHKIKVQGAHYGELRSFAVAGDHLCIGTKQGLFINRPRSDAEQFLRIDAFGTGSIEALAWDDSQKRLLVGTATGDLLAWDMVTPPQHLANLDLNEATLITDGNRIWIASADRITEWVGGSQADVTPSGCEGEVKLLDAGKLLLAWDSKTAWIRPKIGGAWSSVADWPKRVRHVALDPTSGFLLATDRAQLHRIPLEVTRKVQSK